MTRLVHDRSKVSKLVRRTEYSVQAIWSWHMAVKGAPAWWLITALYPNANLSSELSSEPSITCSELARLIAICSNGKLAIATEHARWPNQPRSVFSSPWPCLAGLADWPWTDWEWWMASGDRLSHAETEVLFPLALIICSSAVHFALWARKRQASGALLERCHSCFRPSRLKLFTGNGRLLRLEGRYVQSGAAWRSRGWENVDFLETEGRSVRGKRHHPRLRQFREGVQRHGSEEPEKSEGTVNLMATTDKTEDVQNITSSFMTWFGPAWCVRHDMFLIHCIKQGCVFVCTRALQLVIWDTGGIERFHSATTQLSVLYRNADAAIFVYSVEQSASLHYLTSWLQDLEKFGLQATQKFLVRNKTDIAVPCSPEESDESFVEETTAESFALSNDFKENHCFSMSARTAAGVEESFESIARILHEQHRPQSDPKLLLSVMDEKKASESGGCCWRKTDIELWLCA